MRKRHEQFRRRLERLCARLRKRSSHWLVYGCRPCGQSLFLCHNRKLQDHSENNPQMKILRSLWNSPTLGKDIAPRKFGSWLHSWRLKDFNFALRKASPNVALRAWVARKKFNDISLGKKIRLAFTFSLKQRIWHAASFLRCGTHNRSYQRRQAIEPILISIGIEKTGRVTSSIGHHPVDVFIPKDFVKHERHSRNTSKTWRTGQRNQVSVLLWFHLTDRFYSWLMRFW